MRFRIAQNGDVEAIYSDDARELLQRLGPYELARASHIDPILRPKWYEWLWPGSWYQTYQRRKFYKTFGAGYFGIFWKGVMRKHRVTFVDMDGRPFATKRAAELYEVAMLERRHFRLL